MRKRSKRLDLIPPYLFVKIEEKKAALISSGADLIDFGIGDPDLPTPPHIFKKMHEVLESPASANYPTSKGEPVFRSAVADWYKRRFGVILNPENEVCSLIGSKEGLAHLFLATVDPGDVTLVPDPAYPVYKIGTLLAGGEPYFLPLKAENKFLPDLGSIPPDKLKKAKLLFINYPNNPTGAVAERGFFEKCVEFCKRHDILLVSDLAYSEMAYDGFRAGSVLEIPGAKDIAIEFHSLSKTYNMTGWRVGMAVGNREAVQALATIKSNVDSGLFKAIQYAAVEALTGSQQCVSDNNKIFEERRNILYEGLTSLGFKFDKPRATFYMWVPVPKSETSASFAEKLLEKCRILVVPGSGYGAQGEGYVRLAITITAEKIREAVSRLRKSAISYS